MVRDPGRANTVRERCLRRSWQIVVVVTGPDPALCAETLADVRARSLSQDIEILAVDAAAVRTAIGDAALPVHYSLASAPAPDSHWSSILNARPPAQETTLYLLAGTRVPQHWDARLVAAGQRAADAVGVVPLCWAHPMLGLQQGGTRRPGLDVEDLDQWLNDYARGEEFPVAALPAACLLAQQPRWWHSRPGWRDDAALFWDLRGAGRSVVATDALYVDDSRLEHSGVTEHLAPAYLQADACPPELAAMRHALGQLAARAECPATRRAVLPVQLHVGHSWGGGLGRWIADFLAADAAHHHLVLRSVGDLGAYGRSICLYRGADMDVPIRSWRLAEPVVSVSAGSVEYRAILEELQREFSVESLVVSSVVGHSLDLLRTDLPTTLVMHEFFPFCPALYATFGSPCQSCSPQRLRECARDNPHHAFFPFDPPQYALAVREAFVQCILQQPLTVVAPSDSVLQRYRKLEPRLAGRPMHVVPHGLDTALIDGLRRQVHIEDADPATRLRVVLLGRLSAEKGGDLLAEILPELGAFADLWLLGAGESGARFASQAGVEVVTAYAPAELGDLLRRARPHLGLVLSTVPETFCYTLSELHAAGIPVLATAMGALEERVVQGRNGWLVEPHAAAVLAKLRELDSQRQHIVAAADALGEQPQPTAVDMVQAYAALELAQDEIPLSRYRLPRRSWRNPYTGAVPGATRALHINPGQPYRLALQEFLRHSAARAGQSPAVPRPLRRPLVSLLHALARLAAPAGAHGGGPGQGA